MTQGVQCVADAQAGLALEIAALDGSDATALMWQADARALVCPETLSRRAPFAGAARASTKAGWPLILRPTGGGTVPQGPGVVNLALAFDAGEGFTLEDGYRLITSVLQEGFGPEGHQLAPGATPGSFCDGTWNLSVAGRKMIGTAQRWRARPGGTRRVLAHAMILTQGAIAMEGAAAVSAFQQNMGMPPVRAEVHVTAQEAFGWAHLPASDVLAAAHRALAAL